MCALWVSYVVITKVILWMWKYLFNALLIISNSWWILPVWQINCCRLEVNDHESFQSLFIEIYYLIFNKHNKFANILVDSFNWNPNLQSNKQTKIRAKLSELLFLFGYGKIQLQQINYTNHVSGSEHYLYL